MQSRAKVWLISVALGFSGCAKGALDEPERNRGPQAPATEDDDPDPYGVTPPGSRAGSAGQSGKGGASSFGGSGGRAGSAGASMVSGAGGAGAAGAGGTGASAGLAGTNSHAAAGTAGATDDCPALTHVRLKSGACVDRIKEFSVATNPTSIVTGSDGQVWFDDDGINQLVQLDSEGRVLKRVECDEGSSPRALVGGRDEALVWYTDARAKTLNRVTQVSQLAFELKFTATAVVLGEGDLLWLTEAGQALYQFRPYVSSTPYAVTPSHALAIGPDKNVWFPTGGAIARQIPGEEAQYFSTGANLADELCTGPDSALWFTDGRRHQIGRMDMSGKSQAFDLPFGSTPTRIIAGPDGALWFIAEGGDKIGRITVGGVVTQYPIPTSGGLPYALTVGADRNIWFTERLSGKIGRLIPDPLG